jgi:NitT/TauT family transport system substrate-binding protein
MQPATGPTAQPPARDAGPRRSDDGRWIGLDVRRHGKCRPASLPIPALALLLLLLAVPAAAGETGLKKATFIPQWVPQAQFAGYYVALDKGIYRKHGIDLEILPGGPDAPADALLREGKADFATLWLSTTIPLRAEGVPIVNLAQMMQQSALMLVAKKASGIHEPEDMDGKKVGLWGPIFQIQPRAFFRKYGLDVDVVRQSFSVNLFLRDGVDVASAMWYNEYHTIINSGLNPDELTTFFFHEHGLNFPEDGIYALEETRRRDPELCRAFVRASIEGWNYAFDHPGEALNIVMHNLEKAHIPATRVHQRWMLERMQDLIRPEGTDVPVGTLRREDYLRVAEGLKANGMIETIPPFETFYRSCIDVAK